MKKYATKLMQKKPIIIDHTARWRKADTSKSAPSSLFRRRSRLRLNAAVTPAASS